MSSSNGSTPSLYELYRSGQAEELRKRMGDFDRLEAQCKGNKERLLSAKHNRILAEHLLSGKDSSNNSNSSENDDETKRAEVVAAKLAELYKAAKATEAGVTGLVEYNLAVAQAGLGSSAGNYEALRILQGLFTRIEDLEYWLACRVCLFLAQMYRRLGMPPALGFATLKCLETYTESRRTLPCDVLQASTDPREIPYDRLLRMIAVERSRLSSFSTQTSTSSTSSTTSTTTAASSSSSTILPSDSAKPTLKDIRKEKDPLKMNAKLGAFYTDTNKPKLALICASKVLGMKGGDTPDMRYRAGLQLLCIGKPKKAFEMLCGASRTMSSNPEYWLRLSECCILRHIRRQRKLKVYNYTVKSTQQQPPQSQPQPQTSKSGGMGKTSTGTGTATGTGMGMKPNIRIEYPRRALCDQNSTLERGPTLAFGAKCCKNVLISLRSQARALRSEHTQAATKLLAFGLSQSQPESKLKSSSDPDSNSGSESESESESNSIELKDEGCIFEDSDKSEVIRQNALVNLAWISLCTGDYVTAASAAGQVLRGGRKKKTTTTRMSAETTAFRFLACVYMAEVLATSEEGAAAAVSARSGKDERSERVGRLLEEAMTLAEDAVRAVGECGGVGMFEKVEHVGVSDRDVAMNGLWTNYGVSRVLVDGDLKKAFECFKKANELYKLSQHTILLQSYLTSLINNFDEARNLLKKG